MPWGAGIAVGCWHSSVVEHGLVIKRSQVQVPVGAAGEFTSLGSTFCVDSYFGICSPPPPPCPHHVTAAAHKRALSYCQKYKWQVTAEYTRILHIWLQIKWHSTLVHGWHGVHRMCTEIPGVSIDTRHVATKQRCYHFSDCSKQRCYHFSDCSKQRCYHFSDCSKQRCYHFSDCSKQRCYHFSDCSKQRCYHFSDCSKHAV